MMRRALGLVAVAMAAATSSCIVGPRYVPDEVVRPSQKLGVQRMSDSSRVFFDSLAAARRRDSARTTPAIHSISGGDSLTALAWLDILRDTALVKLVGVALQQNRRMQIAVARIDEFRAAVGVARAPLAPSIALNAGESTNEVALGAFPTTSYRATRITADLAWELDFWGRIHHGVDAARADLGAQEAAERATVLSLVSDVATSYLQLLELDQERAIAERTLTSRQSTLEIARERFSQGLTSELDVKQFEAQVATPAVALALAQRAIAQTEHNLDVLLGQSPMRIPRGGSLVDAARALTVPDSIPAAVLARRPDVQQAERGYAAATARVGMADAARLPTFSIIGSYGAQAGAPSAVFGDQSRVYQAFAGISYPVFDNGRLASMSAAARARAEQARASYENTALNAMREANDALADVRTARDQAVAQATQANALQQALDLATLRYQSGLSTYLDLLDAQRGLFTAELALSQAELGELTAAVQLYKALGGTWNNGGRRP